MLEEFQSTCDRIAEFPRPYRIVEQEIGSDIRRAPVRRFPYGVFYEVELDRVIVLAFFHAKRDPTRRSLCQTQE